MSDIPETVRPDMAPPGVQHRDGLGPLAAYLHVMEARVTALVQRSSAVPLMTAADAGHQAQVRVLDRPLKERLQTGRSATAPSSSLAARARPGRAVAQ